MTSRRLLFLGALFAAILSLSLLVSAQESTDEPPPPLPEQPTSAPSLIEQGGPASATDIQRVTIGQPVKGSLDPSRPSQLYSFAGTAGEIITITMSSQMLDSYLRLGDQRGNQLLTNDDGSTNLDARIGPVALPSDGDYVVVASSFQGTVSGGQGADMPTGEFTMMIERQTPTPVTIPTNVEDELAEDQALRIYSFTGQQGDVLSLTAHSSDFDPFLIVSRMDDVTSPVSQDDDTGNGNDPLIEPYIVPASGQYLVTVTSSLPDNHGRFALEINPLPPTPLVYGDAVDATFDDDHRVLIYSFEGTAGDVVDAATDSANDLDTTMTILGPDGAQIAFNDDSSGRNAGVLGLGLPASGTYTIIIRPFVSGDGDVRVTLGLSQGTPEATPTS